MRTESPIVRIQRVIAAVPRGRVITYGRAAAAAGYPGAARLAVRALRRGEGLPWHRVVAAGGRIALRGVDGQEQRLRLEMEGVSFRGGRVVMETHAWSPDGRRRRSKTSSGPGRGRSAGDPGAFFPAFRRRRD